MMDSAGLSRDFHSILKQVTIHPYAANHQGMSLMSIWLWEIWWMAGQIWCGGREQRTMVRTDSSSGKTTSRKCSMAWVPVDTVCVLPEIEPGHSPIRLPHTYLWWWGAGHWHRRKTFYCSGYGQWVLASSGRRGGARKTGIIYPLWKEMVETDTYGGPKMQLQHL